MARTGPILACLATVLLSLFEGCGPSRPSPSRPSGLPPTTTFGGISINATECSCTGPSCLPVPIICRGPEYSIAARLQIDNAAGSAVELRAISVELQVRGGIAVGRADAPIAGHVLAQIAARSHSGLPFVLHVLPGAAPSPGVLQAHANGVDQDGVPWKATASQVLQPQ
jgi:hypothetical protein